MDERDHRTPGMREDAEEEVRRLLEEAGPRPGAPETELASITETARAAWRQAVERRTGRSRRRAWTIALAAVLTLGVGLAAWWALRSPGAPAVGRLEASSGEVRLDDSAELPTAGRELRAGAVLTTGGASTPEAGRAALRLAQGATLRLDAGTRVRLVTPGRIELERGAIYADTGTGGDHRALAVETPLGVALDVGTRFVVRLGDEEPGLRVQVREGRVALQRGGETLVTGAGYELVVRADGSTDAHAIDPYGDPWRWVLEAAAPFDIEGRTLGELLDVASRELGWTVRFEPPSLADGSRAVVLHGTTGDLALDRAILALLPGAGLRGDLADRVLTIRANGG